MLRELHLAILTIFGLAACDGTHDSRTKRLVAAVDEKAPNDGHQWLEIENLFGEWEKVTLVFGYVDNPAACQELAALARESTIANRSGARYRCVPAQ